MWLSSIHHPYRHPYAFCMLIYIHVMAKNPSVTGHTNKHPFWIERERVMYFGLQQAVIYFSLCEADMTCDGERILYDM
jgi:hypothetical protein